MSLKKKHFPQESVAARGVPTSMNEHLKGTWCNVRNDVQRDQDAVKRCKKQIASCKRDMLFVNNRIVANLHALDAIEGVK